MPTARTAAIPFPRPRWHRTLAACAAVLLVGLLAWWQWPQAVPPAENYACASGGYQRVLLRDGSVLELNENSSVRVTFTAEVRRVTLQTGEAHFRVAKDSRRPFVVAAGDVAVRAVGTAFLVRVDPASVNLLVTEGRVAVTESNPAAARIGAGDPAASDGPHLVDVSAGEQTKIPRHTHPDRRGEKPAIERPTAAAIRLALSWQEKWLVFDAVPLGAAIDEFNRRNRLQLVVADPQLAARPVAGTFAADNVEGFVRLMEQSGTLVAERRGDFEITLRPISGGSR